MRAFLERVQRSCCKVCRSRASLERTWLTWAVHRRCEVRTRPRCLCILTFFRVMPLRLIAKSEEKGRLVNSIDTVLSTLTANFQAESHAHVSSTDLYRWPSHSVGDGITVVRGVACKLAAVYGNCHAVRQVNCVGQEEKGATHRIFEISVTRPGKWPQQWTSA